MLSFILGVVTCYVIASVIMFISIWRNCAEHGMPMQRDELPRCILVASLWWLGLIKPELFE